MRSAKLLVSSTPVSVTVAPVAAEDNTDEPMLIGTPTDELIEAFKKIPSGYASHKQFRRERDAMYDWDASPEDLDD